MLASLRGSHSGRLLVHVRSHSVYRLAGEDLRPRRLLSRGFGPASRPARPLVSYQINRQLSGWNLPPLAIRAFGAHGTNPNHAPRGVKRRRSARNTAMQICPIFEKDLRAAADAASKTSASSSLAATIEFSGFFPSAAIVAARSPATLQRGAGFGGRKNSGRPEELRRGRV